MVEKKQTTQQAYETPKWVKRLGLAGAMLLVVVALAMATGHGPWRHMGMAMPEHAAQ